MRKFKICDTCGVNNLHGMPAIFGGLLSVLMAGIASKDQYDQFNKDYKDPSKSSLYEIFPAFGEEGLDWTAGKQAGAQFSAILVTLAIAIVGGVLTGSILLQYYLQRTNIKIKKCRSLRICSEVCGQATDEVQERRNCNKAGT